jgi:DNA-binding PadR family transcriptional regulator
MVADMSVRRSNPLALAILVYLMERERHPYEIATDMRERHLHEAIKLNYGSLYSVIAALERDGLISQRATIRDGRRPERTIYTLTDAGRREALDWLAELVAAPVKEYVRFQAALSLIGVLSPDEVVELLRRRLGTLETRLAVMSAQLSVRGEIDLPRLFILETEYEQRLLAAERDFVAELLAEIEDGSFERLDEWRALHEGLHSPTQTGHGMTGSPRDDGDVTTTNASTARPPTSSSSRRRKRPTPNEETS